MGEWRGRQVSSTQSNGRGGLFQIHCKERRGQGLRCMSRSLVSEAALDYCVGKAIELHETSARWARLPMSHRPQTFQRLQALPSS